MNRVFRAALALGFLPLSAEAAEPRFFIRDVSSRAACHAEYDSLAGDWRHHPWFQRRVLPDGREHVLNCLPDGAEEFVCNPAGGKLAVAVVAGRTEAPCHAFTPGLPVGPALLPVR